MPAKVFVLSSRANKEIDHLPLKIQNKINKVFEEIKKNPISGARLHGDLAGYFKYRVGDYRIVYIFNSKESTVEIVTVEHRQGVYK